MGANEAFPFEDFDPGSPSIARVYDYWLGGKHDFEADCLLAEQIMRIRPAVVATCRDNRTFIVNAVRWVARQGVRQFLDLGAGLPRHPSVDETVREVDPAARVCYVDNDPAAALHSQVLFARPEGITAAEADLTKPDAVWANPGVDALIDRSAPVCLIFGSVFHFFDLATARTVVQEYTTPLPPGSAAVISVFRDDDPVHFRRGRDAYTAGALHNHSRDEIVSLFTGLELVPPGLAPAHAWRGGQTVVPNHSADTGIMLGGVGIKPAWVRQRMS